MKQGKATMEEKTELRYLTCHELNTILKTYQTFEGKHEQSSALSSCSIEDFDFSGIDLSGIFAIGSVFTRCKFVNCDLYGTIFDESKFIDTDFTGANLGKTNFYQVDAKSVCFDSTNCGSAEFDEADLSGATFRNANLGGASFVDCNLTNVVFDGADLKYASIVKNIEEGTSWKNVKNWH